MANKVSITLKNEEELKKSLASNVQESSIEFAGLSEEELTLVEIKIKELKANDPEGKLEVIVTVKLNTSDETAEKSITFDGFKKDSTIMPTNIKSEQLWKASRAGKIFNITGTQEELKQEIESFLNDKKIKNKILAATGDGKLKKGKKAGTIFKGVTILEECKSFVISHGGEATFGSYEGSYSSNTKGFTIVKENDKYYFGWRCLDSSGQPIDEAQFKIEICNA